MCSDEFFLKHALGDGSNASVLQYFGEVVL